jgi:hypothetical protein
VEAARIQTGNGNWGGMKQMRGKGGGRTSIRVSGAAAVAAPSQNREGGEKNSGETFCFLFRGRRNWSFFFGAAMNSGGAIWAACAITRPG